MLITRCHETEKLYTQFIPFKNSSITQEETRNTERTGGTMKEKKARQLPAGR